MTQAGTIAAGKLKALLQDADGLAVKFSAAADERGLEVPALAAEQILAQSAGADIHEKSMPFRYPAVLVYCERIRNEQTEKFRRFSGTAEVVIDLRVSQDRLEGLEGVLGALVDSAIEVLDSRRGDWGDCVYHSGGYEVAWTPARRGGASLIQQARITVPVHVSIG